MYVTRRAMCFGSCPVDRSVRVSVDATEDGEPSTSKHTMGYAKLGRSGGREELSGVGQSADRRGKSAGRL